MITGIELKGAERFASTLERAGRDLANLERPGAEAGRIIADLSAATAPRITGALAASVRPEVAGNTVEVGSDLVYALPIHNGWAAHHIRPQPFLDDAARDSEAQWVGAYDKAVNAALEGVEGV